MAMEQDSRRSVNERSQAAIAWSRAAVRAEEPVMGEGHRNGQDIACRLHREPRTAFAVPARMRYVDHSWEEFNER